MDTPGIEHAAVCIQSGDIVAFPTETVYGLGADATNDKAVARIFEAKERPQFNPLIVHFNEIDAVWKETGPSEVAIKLAKAFWPGPLTLVLNRASDCKLSPLVSAGLDSVAVRVPAHVGAQLLLTEAGVPIAAPSANRSGSISPTTAEHVYTSLGDRVPLILDGGSCDVGLESTIVDLTADVPAVLRPGGISKNALQRVLDTFVDQPKNAKPTDETAPKAPGQLLSHYAPNTSVRLSATHKKMGDVLLGFGPVEGATLNLSQSGDLLEAAANFFAMLHQLDAMNASCIAVSPIPATGLGEAINDRLRRAAAIRD